MADSFIQLPSDSTGKKVDTRTESINSEHREVHVIGDPAVNAGVAGVDNIDPASNEWGVVVRDVNTSAIAANTAPLLTGVTVSGINTSSVTVYTRQANPTAVAADYVPMAADDLGRPLTRPIQVRDLILTSYTSITSGTETTLLTAAAGTYADLIYILGANTSNAAQQIDIRAVSAGNVMLTLEIPANSTAGIATPVPIPQDATGNAWTADNADVTNSTVYITALFSKEV